MASHWLFPFQHRFQESPCSLMRWIGEDEFGRPCLDDLAVVKHDDAVRGLSGKAHLVGNNEHSHVPAVREITQNLEHLTDQLGVKSRSYFVKQHHLWL